MIVRAMTGALWLFVAQAAVGQDVPIPDTGEVATVEPVHDNNLRVEVPAATPQAMRYYRSGNILWCINTLLGFAIPVLILFTGLSGRIGDMARRLGRYWFFTIVVYCVAYMVLTYLIQLPLTFYETYVREHAYGLSNQTLGKWATDSLVSLVVGVVAGTLLLWIPYLLLRKSPRRWWLYTWLTIPPLLCFFTIIHPVYIAPLFNDFGAMNDKQLETKILELAGRAGIEGGRVFEVNKSVDTKTVNAYVTGFGNTKRIVFWDTILERFDESELVFVMGHEMGHYVLGHMVIGIVVFSVLCFFGLYFVHRTAGWFIGRTRRRFGFDHLHDVASLPLLVLLFSLFVFVASPVLLALSRYHEHEADRFGLEITRLNHAAASGFVKDMEEEPINPRPGFLYVLMRATHPPVGSRIDFYNDYRPWESGTSLKYESYFREEARVGDSKPD